MQVKAPVTLIINQNFNNATSPFVTPAGAGPDSPRERPAVCCVVDG